MSNKATKLLERFLDNPDSLSSADLELARRALADLLAADAELRAIVAAHEQFLDGSSDRYYLVMRRLVAGSAARLREVGDGK